MLSNRLRKYLFLSLASLLLHLGNVYAQDASNVATVSEASLPINVANEDTNNDANRADNSVSGETLVSPSKAVTAPSPQVSADTAKEEADASSVKANETDADNFNFDLKMKSINEASESQQGAEDNASQPKKLEKPVINDADLPKEFQYKSNPAENLGNSVLSQMDSDLFTQMSEIEKSTTLLTLELRREKIRNEIEAQKAIRRKNVDDFEKSRMEEQLRNLEKKKQIEAQVIKEKQLLIDKEKVYEILKQRKLLNAYMNHMLTTQQEWLKEKESLYGQLAAVEQEKKELIELFKIKIGKVLEASSKNIQTAEAAKVNFERIVKGLKARNEQLRKRIEADAQIIKNTKSNLYLKSQSIEELRDRNAAMNASMANSSGSTSIIAAEAANVVENTLDDSPSKLSTEYAILGITGRSGVMSVELIDASGQPISLKVGSPLPTGHIVKEIGSDYVKFSRDGYDDYLYVGKTIDGVTPTLGLSKDGIE